MNAQTEGQTTDVQANFDNKVDVKDFKFHFKKVTDKESGIETKRPTVELKLPIPSVEGIIAILEAGGKQLELLLTAVENIVVDQARSMLSDNEAMAEHDFPMDQCTWDAIANMPEAEKRGRGIPKEVWADFVADYIAVMPAITGKSVESVSLAAKLFAGKYQAIKTNKPVIRKLKDQLAIYFNNSSQAEQFVDCVKFLDEKADTLLSADDTATLLAALD
jgi:hypothetical protein